MMLTRVSSNFDVMSIILFIFVLRFYTTEIQTYLCNIVISFILQHRTLFTVCYFLFTEESPQFRIFICVLFIVVNLCLSFVLF